MLGTGESPSSSRESTTPSTTSSSCMVGTNCCHIASPGSLMRSSMAGVMRIWKLSNAGPRASTSISRSATSWPKRSATYACSLSRLSTLWWTVFCQSLIRASGMKGRKWQSARGRGESSRQHDPIVTGRIEVTESRGLLVAPSVIETPRRGVVVARGRLDHDQAGAPLRQDSFDFVHERGAGAGALRRGMYRDPVEVVRAVRRRRRAETGVSDERAVVECSEELVVRRRCGLLRGAPGRRRERFVEQLERDVDLRVREDARCPDDTFDVLTMTGSERADGERSRHLFPPAKSSSSGDAGTGIPDNCWASTHCACCGCWSRLRVRPSSVMVRTSVGYSIPAVRAIRARPASGAMSGFEFTSRIHG